MQAIKSKIVLDISGARHVNESKDFAIKECIDNDCEIEFSFGGNIYYVSPEDLRKSIKNKSTGAASGT